MFPVERTTVDLFSKEDPVETRGVSSFRQSLNGRKSKIRGLAFKVDGHRRMEETKSVSVWDFI